MTIQVIFGILFRLEIVIVAGIAQSVEQLIRNQQVVCSSHITSSILFSQKQRFSPPFLTFLYTYSRRFSCAIVSLRARKYMLVVEKLVEMQRPRSVSASGP